MDFYEICSCKGRKRKPVELPYFMFLGILYFSCLVIACPKFSARKKIRHDGYY